MRAQETLHAMGRLLRPVRRRRAIARLAILFLAAAPFLVADPVLGQQQDAGGDWERKATQLTQFRLESYSPTQPNTPIKGTYMTQMAVGAMAGRSAVMVQCVFTFSDWEDPTLCGTGKVKFTATIGGKNVFRNKAVKFSRDRCHRSIWYSLTVDLTGYDPADEFVCTAKVKDKAKLQPVDSASISYEAHLKDLTWDSDQ